MADIYFKILRACQRLQTAFSTTNYHYHFKHIISAGSYSLGGWATCMACSLCKLPESVTSPLLVLGPFLFFTCSGAVLGQLFRSLCKWAEVAHSNGYQVAFEIQRGPLGIVFCLFVFFPLVGGSRGNNLALAMEDLSWHAHNAAPHQILLRWKASELLLDLFSTSDLLMFYLQ